MFNIYPSYTSQLNIFALFTKDMYDILSYRQIKARTTYLNLENHIFYHVKNFVIYNILTIKSHIGFDSYFKNICVFLRTHNLISFFLKDDRNNYLSYKEVGYVKTNA